MRWEHPDHRGRRIRLAYGLNLHGAEDLAGTLAGMRAITLPLRARLASRGERFGVGMYLPGAVARGITTLKDEGWRGLADLARLVMDNELDPFTFNAFPFGGFHRDGLKTRVFKPSWLDEKRVDYTIQVAHVAWFLAVGCGDLRPPAHISISTHSGAFGAAIRGEADRIAIAQNLARAVARFARIESDTGIRVVLALEAEPRSSCNDGSSLAAFLGRVREWGTATVASELGCGEDAAHDHLERHLGTCLDTCHSAVEFEEPERALWLAGEHGPVAKLQFSSALRLDAPGSDAEGRAELLALDEPRYLHQVTGFGPAGRCAVDDLGDLRAILNGDLSARAQWLACEEWRCHFHVPVDLDRVGGTRLKTTRAHADAILAAALADPARWGTEELHLEIETYTWEILPGFVRGSGSLVDGLEREYAHVTAELVRAGWRSTGTREGGAPSTGG